MVGLHQADLFSIVFLSDEADNNCQGQVTDIKDDAGFRNEFRLEPKLKETRLLFHKALIDIAEASWPRVLWVELVLRVQLWTGMAESVADEAVSVVRTLFAIKEIAIIARSAKRAIKYTIGLKALRT